jgi:DUF4097 and DUF4098 domain-containing protein YvlB
MKRPVVITLLVTALTLVCVGIGAVVFFAVNNGFPNNNPFDRLNISSTLEESKTVKVDAEKPITLKVNNAAGDVTVTGGDVDSVQVKVVKTAYDSTQVRADEEVKTIKYTVEQSGNAITLKYELPKSMNFSNNINTVDFIVTVPTETTVTVDTGFGEVSVTDTKGDAKLENDFGDVTAQNIEGGLSVQTNSGTVEAISIKAGSKDIELRSDFGNITLEKANAADITFQSNSGKITLKDVNATGDFYSKSDFGDTKYENGSAASVTIESNSGKVELTKLKVKRLIKVDDDFGDITLTQATAASYDLHTNSGAITVDGVKGTLKASTDFGNIEVTNAEEAVLDLKTNSGSVEFSGSLGEEPHFVKSDFGNITLVLPADSKLNVDLKTDFGNIKSDLPITVTLTESSGNDGDEIAGAINDGGAQLTVQTNSGNININAMK